MTVINVAVQHDRLHVLTDSAHYSSNGVLHGFAPKAFPVSAWPGIVAARGPSFATPILGQALALTFRSFDALVEGVSRVLPDALNLLPRMNDPSLSAVELIIAGYSESRDAFESYVITTSRSLPHGLSEDEMAALRAEGNAIESKPFELIRLPQVAAAPLPGGTDLEGTGFDKIYIDDKPEQVIRDLRVLLEVQRHMAIGGQHLVGGSGHLLTLDRDGITMREICRWDDEIGKPITPGPIDWKAWHASRAASTASNTIDFSAMSRLKREMLQRKQRKASR